MISSLNLPLRNHGSTVQLFHPRYESLDVRMISPSLNEVTEQAMHLVLGTGWVNDLSERIELKGFKSLFQILRGKHSSAIVCLFLCYSPGLEEATCARTGDSARWKDKVHNEPV